MRDQRAYTLFTDNKGNVTGVIDLFSVAGVQGGAGCLEFTMYSGAVVKIPVDNPQHWLREIAIAFGLHPSKIEEKKK